MPHQTYTDGMKTALLGALVLTIGLPILAQEKKVPDDSERIYIPGCSKGLVFTVGERREDQPGRSDVKAGAHFRMSGPKQVMNDIKAHEGSMIEITGLVRKGQIPPGLRLGPVTISPGPTSGTNLAQSPNIGQVIIDVEGWRALIGDCPR